jgi:hypothetical protein
MNTNDTSEQDKVLARIRKMLALANDAAASDGERENAMRMVHNTLAKHNLTMAHAEAHGATPSEAREAGAADGRDFPWARQTAHAIAQLMFCRYFFVPRGNGKVTHTYVGRVGNVATARETANYVIASIIRESARAARSGGHDGSWERSFAKGAAARISERCAALRLAAEANDVTDLSTGRELVLASVYETEAAANAAFIERSLGINLRKSKDRSRGAGAGYGAGRDFGDKVGLNRQVGATSSNTRRIAQ